MAKFPDTFCSQCGESFGPGDSGYSHCQDHRAVRGRNSDLAVKIDRRTYIVGLSHEEIRDTRQALVLWAQTYRDLAENGKFTPETKAILNREADGAMDVANRLSSIITRRANLDQSRAVIIPIRGV